MSIYYKILPQLIYIGYIYIGDIYIYLLPLMDIWSVYSFYNMIKVSINTVLYIPELRVWLKLGCKNSSIVHIPGGSEVKASACNAGDLGSIPGLGRSPGEGNGNPLQYSCLENPMDGGAWWATVYGVAKNRTWLSKRLNTF